MKGWIRPSRVSLYCINLAFRLGVFQLLEGVLNILQTSILIYNAQSRAGGDSVVFTIAK